MGGAVGGGGGCGGGGVLGGSGDGGGFDGGGFFVGGIKGCGGGGGGGIGGDGGGVGGLDGGGGGVNGGGGRAGIPDGQRTRAAGFKRRSAESIPTCCFGWDEHTVRSSSGCVRVKASIALSPLAVQQPSVTIRTQAHDTFSKWTAMNAHCAHREGLARVQGPSGSWVTLSWQVSSITYALTPSAGINVAD